MKPILNIDEVQFNPFGRGDRFEARVGPISPRVGAQKLGYNVTVVPPGKRAYPIHNHHANEEMFFVLDGEGEVRIGQEKHPLRKGDVLACPPGGRETAHQIVNTGSVDLRYLAVSTKIGPEFVEYPDSNKLAAASEVRGPDGKATQIRIITHEPATFDDYWEGEA